MTAFDRRPIVVKLTDGPCADRYATVLSWGDDCYQKLDHKTEAWFRYLKNLYKPGEYIWSGEGLTTNELQMKVHNDKQNTYGATQGA